MTTTEKTCFKCGAVKSIGEFYKHSRMADGHLGKCKECTKKDNNENRKKNHEHFMAYDRARAVLPHRVENRKRVTFEYAMKFPQRMVANYTVTRAVRNGKLSKLPCLICGSTKVVAHHPDYDRPLDVVWLCQMHHKQAHALITQ